MLTWVANRQLVGTKKAAVPMYTGLFLQTANQKRIT